MLNPDGIGYVLDGGFDMPPLMLTADEVEAAVLGAKWVAVAGDPALARAAQDLIAKIAAIVPARLRTFVLEPAVTTPQACGAKLDMIDIARVRAWCQAGRKVALRYRDEEDRETDRKVWPFLVGYREASRVLVAWCELREDFRTFRADRVVTAQFLDERYAARPSALRANWHAASEGRA